MARELPLRSKSMWKWTKLYDLALNDFALNHLVVKINPVPASGGPSSLAQASDDLAT